METETIPSEVVRKKENNVGSTKWCSIGSRNALTNENKKQQQDRQTHKITQLAGHNPPTVGSPGNLADISMIPPMKQNLFHDWIIPDLNSFVTLT
jgi:hypothetical protein